MCSPSVTLIFVMTGWRRVGELIDEDMPRLHRMTWTAFAKYAGLSYTTVNELRRGIRTGYDSTTKASIERALHWEYGSIDAIVDGRRNPTRISDPHLGKIRHFWPDLSLRDRAMLADLAERNASR